MSLLLSCDHCRYLFTITVQKWSRNLTLQALLEFICIKCTGSVWPYKRGVPLLPVALKTTTAPRTPKPSRAASIIVFVYNLNPKVFTHKRDTINTRLSTMLRNRNTLDRLGKRSDPSSKKPQRTPNLWPRFDHWISECNCSTRVDTNLVSSTFM